MDLRALGLVVMVGLAAAFDLGTKRIPNALTLSGLAAAFVLRGLGGVDPLVSGLLGALLAFALSFPLFAAGGMGGGDVKLLVAVGAFLGPVRLVIAFLAMGVVGGLMGLAAAARRRALKTTFLGVRDVAGGVARYFVASSGAMDTPKLGKPGAITVPYGIAIGLGAVAGLVF